MPTPSTMVARSISAMTERSTSRLANTSKAAPRRILRSPRGKILRINPDGTVPTDNPFYDGADPITTPYGRWGCAIPIAPITTRRRVGC